MASDYITCWVDPMIGAYLDDLVRVGTHGADRDAVVRTLLSMPIRLTPTDTGCSVLVIGALAPGLMGE